MSGLHTLFRTNARAEEEGVWLDYEEANTRIKVARAGGSNKKFQRRLEALSRPHRRALQADMMSTEKIRKLTLEAYLDTVVMDWESMTEDGEWVKGIFAEDDVTVLPFDKDTARATFERLPDLFDDVVDYAQKMNLFRDEVLEAEGKNS